MWAIQPDAAQAVLLDGRLVQGRLFTRSPPAARGGGR